MMSQTFEVREMGSLQRLVMTVEFDICKIYYIVESYYLCTPDEIAKAFPGNSLSSCPEILFFKSTIRLNL